MKNIYDFIFLVSMFLGFFMPLIRIQAETVVDVPAPPLAKKFPYTFSIASSFGILYGQGEEIVYKYQDKDTYWSQLLWDMKPLFYVGSSLHVSRTNPLEKWGFGADLALKLGIPNKTGVMEDRDWLAVDHDGLTHFSSHDNYTQGAFLLDFSAGISIPFASMVLLKAYGGLSYMQFSWAAQDGFTQYAPGSYGTYEPWDDSIAKTPVYGPTISYLQEWLIFTPGISLYVPFLRFFSIELFFNIGPVIFCNDRDDHLLATKRYQYVEHMSRGLLLEPRVEFAFSPHPRLDLSLYLAYRSISGSRGESWSRYTGTTADGILFKTSTDAGAGYSALDAGFSLGIWF